MITLDSYAVLALLKDEPASSQVADILRSGDAQLTPLGVAEVIDHLVRLADASEDQAALDLAQLGLLDPRPIGGDTGLRAGLLRARHYDRRTRAVNLADCFAAEVARAEQGVVATADPGLVAMCHEEGIDVLVLPDSRGRAHESGGR